jgi:hypothetical protein
METRNVKISLETAQRWYNGTDKELKELAVQTYPELAKKELPKSWVELENITGYYLNLESKAKFIHDCHTDKTNSSIFATKEQAEASIAMAQLSQLMKVYNDGWEPDWSDKTKNKFCIDTECGKISKYTYTITGKFLSFKDVKTRDLFLENFRELIEQAKPLL